MLQHEFWKIMLREIDQSQKDKYFIIPHMSYLEQSNS
jgi:hypothetical protein